MGGAAVMFAGAVALLAASWGNPPAFAVFAVYGACAVALFLASGIYHSLHKAGVWLQKLDHMAIYLMIAGSYTPIAVLALPREWAIPVLVAQWGLAAIGVFVQATRTKTPSWLRLTLYLTMGWMALGILGPLSASIGSGPVGWLIAGGVVYTVGAIVYATGRPRLWPGKFGSHELWHCFVLGGAACHFVVMVYLTRLAL